MKVYTHLEDLITVARSHPWTQALSNPNQKYYDFKSSPELIRTSLEDFLPLNQWSGTEKFYDLLEWLNGSDSLLESNDCGTRGFKQNTNTNFPKMLECSARLMILYRNLNYNLSEQNINWLERRTHNYLESIDIHFEWGVVGTSIIPATYITLPLPDHEQVGSQLLLQFWAWGDSDLEVMDNFGRISINVKDALIEVCRDVKASMQ